MYEITVVNRKTYKGESEYIGREMRNIKGSPLGNPYRVKPYGPYDRDESVMVFYKRWLWNQMKNKTGAVYQELLRLKALAEQAPVAIACWCHPETCHGEVVRAAILFLAKEGAATETAA